MEYASNAKGNLGVTLGAIGTGLGVLSGGATMLGGGMCPAGGNIQMMLNLASKDSEIAMLKAEQASEVKMTEVYRQSRSELVDLRDRIEQDIRDLQREVRDNKKEQDAWNANQNVVNANISAAIATNTNSIACLKNVVDQITMIKIPNTAVCPGWGQVAVTPVTTGTTVG